MDDPVFNVPPVKTLWQHICAGLKRAHANRPISFYLLLSIPVVLILGVELASHREDPHKFFFFLALLFTFLLVIISRAVVDFIEIARRGFSEDHKIIRTTLFESGFIDSLKKKEKDGEK